jgi:dephospho-CoA kinase
VLRVALTGGIATGKSYVRAGLEARGVATIDADVLAREVVAAGTPGLAAIAARFGPAVLDAAGALDRSALAGIVFGDAAARRDLESIIHPLVYAAIQRWFDALPAALGVADIPLLFETGHEGAFDVVVCTFCPPEVQMARLQQRDGLSADAARARLAAQWPIAEKARLADYVIRTDGTFAATDAQIAFLDAELRARAQRS